LTLFPGSSRLFARNLTHNLAACAHPLQVTWFRPSENPFTSFWLSSGDQLCLLCAQWSRWAALAVLQLDLALAPPIIDLLLGGEGRRWGAARVDRHRGIDSGQLSSEIILPGVTAAWQPWG